MGCQDYITTEPERKRGQHLGPTERGAIQELRKLGFSYRAIAHKVNCAHGTVQNELKLGTPPRKSRKGRAPGYSAKRGQSVPDAGGAVRSIPRQRLRCLTPLLPFYRGVSNLHLQFAMPFWTMKVQKEQPLTYLANRPIINSQLANKGNGFDVIQSVVYTILNERNSCHVSVVVPLLQFLANCS